MDFIPDKIIESRKGRKAVYGIIAAVVAALVTFGVIDQGVADQINEIVLGVLTLAGTFLAGKNVPEEVGESEPDVPVDTESLGQ